MLCLGSPLRRIVPQARGITSEGSRRLSEPPTTAQSPSADPARTPAEAAFDRDWYLGAYPDVAAAGVDPFEHYKRHGKGEGRHPTAAAAEAALGFDRDWYLRAYSDVAAAAVDPVEHYKMYGKGEGRHPTQASAEEAIGFDRAWYLAAYPDVAAAGVRSLRPLQSVWQGGGPPFQRALLVFAAPTWRLGEVVPLQRL